ISFEIDTESLEAGTYEYSFSTDDDEVNSGEIYVIECPNDDEVPEHGAIDAEDLSERGMERVNIDIRLVEDGDEYSDSELIAIAKEAVCIFTQDDEWNAIGLTFWEPGQTPGYEQAYAECNWAPDGVWGRADDVDTGDYSTHEFNLRRF
ncbi:hypothetical protein RBH26_21190, partial [Natronolimnohabitans sp. A-GB9]|uniref:hypothetical protein n=1 Tax=Natronolimnohabitans sp. A-GB9 TaxID=3069757 RepID=UPI0027B0F96A